MTMATKLAMTAFKSSQRESYMDSSVLVIMIILTLLNYDHGNKIGDDSLWMILTLMYNYKGAHI